MEREPSVLVLPASDPNRVRRVVLRYSVLDLRADDWEARGLAPQDGDALVRATGWKIISDGSNQGRTGRQRRPNSSPWGPVTARSAGS